MQLVVNSEKDVDAYDPLTGAALWKLKCLDGEVAPSPAYAVGADGIGMIFVANDTATSTAIRLNPKDKTPAAEIAWQWDETLPDVASPLGAGLYFYIATSRGEIVCLDRTTGKPAWTQEFDKGFYASPILVGDRIYAVDRKGTAQVFKTGPAYASIAAPKLGEDLFATPAFMDGRIYFRTEKQLICIASQDAPAR
jgi:outer membrane protein assembly factor BamB